MIGEALRALLPKSWHQSHPVVPVIRMTGPIGLPPSPLRQSLSMTQLAGPLASAFKLKRARAVAIVINSPGGSPVQSTLIFKRIRALADEHNKQVHVFIEDVGASGGYLIALAGDEIIADASSVVGSIGVISAGFGFDRAIEKLGIDRRVYTAGDRKLSLDPFQPEKADDIRRIKALQKDIHETFIDLVKTRRSDRLDGTDKQLFSGEFWSGKKAVELGLVDGLGDLRSHMREVFGEKVRLLPVPVGRRGLFGRLSVSNALAAHAMGDQPGSALDGVGTQAGYGAAMGAISAAEERALWARYGM
jgi:signal peptide peptidase SppA